MTAHFYAQVGPVIDPNDPGSDKFKGQYIAAGYTGHGMPRAFAWYACIQLSCLIIPSEHDMQSAYTVLKSLLK